MFVQLKHRIDSPILTPREDILNIFFTTVALALELAATPAMAGRYVLWEVQCARTSSAMICAIYVFELVFRYDMRPPLYVARFRCASLACS